MPSLTREWVEALSNEVDTRLEEGEDAQYILEDILRRLEEMAR